VLRHVPLYHCRHVGHGGRLEKGPQRHLDAEYVNDSGNYLAGEQRVSSQFKKTVVGSDLIHL